jgi:hypothetical protein
MSMTHFDRHELIDVLVVQLLAGIAELQFDGRVDDLNSPFSIYTDHARWLRFKYQPRVLGLMPYPVYRVIKQPDQRQHHARDDEEQARCDRSRRRRRSRSHWQQIIRRDGG